MQSRNSFSCVQIKDVALFQENLNQYNIWQQQKSNQTKKDQMLVDKKRKKKKMNRDRKK